MRTEPWFWRIIALPVNAPLFRTSHGLTKMLLIWKCNCCQWFFKCTVFPPKYCCCPVKNAYLKYQLWFSLDCAVPCVLNHVLGNHQLHAIFNLFTHSCHIVTNKVLFCCQSCSLYFACAPWRSASSGGGGGRGAPQHYPKTVGNRCVNRLNRSPALVVTCQQSSTDALILTCNPQLSFQVI